MNRDGTDPLSVAVEHHGEATTVVLAGELDFATVFRLRDVVHGVMAAGHRHVVLDLSGLRLCDSTGVGALFGLHQRLEREGGRLELTGATATVRKVLEITAMDRMLHLTA